jgi:hypothetical protein
MFFAGYGLQMICTLSYESSIFVLKCERIFLSTVPVIPEKGLF